MCLVFFCKKALMAGDITYIMTILSLSKQIIIKKVGTL